MEFKTISLFTKQQVERAIRDWGADCAPPKKGQCVYINFPDRTCVRVSNTGERQDKRALYRVEFAAA